MPVTSRGRPGFLRRLLRARPADLDPLQSHERRDEAFEAAWRSAVRARVLVVLAVTAVWALAIAGRLVALQVVQHEALLEQAERQQQQEIARPATRGDIVDRHGALLAYSVDADAVVAVPRRITDAAATVDALCRAFADCTPQERADLVTRLSNRSAFRYVRRARFVSPEQARRVAALGLDGVMLMTEPRRFYPNVELAAHLIGFVGTGNVGRAGVEEVFDEPIRGRDGRAFVQTDALQTRILTREDEAPASGATIELTIDRALQHIAERELAAAVARHGARGGTILVMDPWSGEILALANAPTFNPNVYGRFPEEHRRNRATQEIYEPGSTFKIVTAAAAIEEGVVSPSDPVDCSPGFITFGSRVISDVSPHGTLSFQDVLVKSSNVGAIKVGLRVGADRLSRYVRRFGFGEALSPDFRGQSRGLVYAPANLTDSALASVAMGYQIGVTPLQMAAAVSAVANGGLLLQPRAVRAVTRAGGREAIEPVVVRRVVEPATAATLTAIMEDAVVRGTARAAALDRYQVAGKTGTAAKLVDGRYSKSEYNASFVGFVPSRRPAFTILVVIDTPRGDEYYGGQVAAPVFRRVAEAALRQAGVAPTINPVPPVILAGPPAPDPRPVPVAWTPAGSRVTGPGTMPDVRGLGARDALRALGAAGLQVRMDGTGVVLDQAPAPGAPVEPGGWSDVRLGLPPRVPPREGGRP